LNGFNLRHASSEATRLSRKAWFNAALRIVRIRFAVAFLALPASPSFASTGLVARFAAVTLVRTILGAFERSPCHFRMRSVVSFSTSIEPSSGTMRASAVFRSPLTPFDPSRSRSSK
jgi:hypothetical protein